MKDEANVFFKKKKLVIGFRDPIKVTERTERDFIYLFVILCDIIIIII